MVPTQPLLKNKKIPSLTQMWETKRGCKRDQEGEGGVFGGFALGFLSGLAPLQKVYLAAPAKKKKKKE